MTTLDLEAFFSSSYLRDPVRLRFVLFSPPKLAIHDIEGREGKERATARNRLTDRETEPKGERLLLLHHYSQRKTLSRLRRRRRRLMLMGVEKIKVRID